MWQLIKKVEYFYVFLLFIFFCVRKFYSHRSYLLHELELLLHQPLSDKQLPHRYPNPTLAKPPSQSQPKKANGIEKSITNQKKTI